jgi:Icc-related predicted phosphoesterase
MVRIAAVGDLHYCKASQGSWSRIFGQVGPVADLLLLCGDLTDHGLIEEGQLLAREIESSIKVPVVAVLGNHDYEAGHVEEIAAALSQAHVQILDGDSTEVLGIGIAGTKGFAGGFGRATLGAWGEPAIKSFVQEAVNEALKLESALARLRTPRRLVLLHYAPIKGTVEGEPVEIYPWLGTSRLEEPIDRYRATAVFHGHAHNGAAEGQTLGQIPVYNVSLPLCRRQNAERPFKILTIDEEQPTTAERV